MFWLINFKHQRSRMMNEYNNLGHMSEGYMYVKSFLKAQRIIFLKGYVIEYALCVYFPDFLLVIKNNMFIIELHS